MYCKHCGKEIPENAAICLNCGAFADLYVPAVRTADPKPPAPPRNPAAGIALSAVGFAIVLVGMMCVLPAFFIPETPLILLILLTGADIVGLGLSIAGLVLSIRARSAVGKGFSIAGIVLGAIWLFFTVLLIVLTMIAAASFLTFMMFLALLFAGAGVV